VSQPKVAFVGTGGTIASVGTGPLDIVAYARTGKVFELGELLARVPELALVADVVEAPYRNVHSTAIGPEDWPKIARHIQGAFDEDPDIQGAVVTHGTSTLEETAYYLNLTLKTEKTVVLVGAQRPATALSTDGYLNLVNGARVAAAPEARGLGVLVCLNDEIHAARDVTKTSTTRLQTFVSPDFGMLGHADADAINIYRKPVRAHTTATPFAIETPLPRVDVAMSYAGSDGQQIRGLLQANPKGLVVAGFAPGLVSPGEREAIVEAIEAGVTVVQATRSLSGRVVEIEGLRPEGMLISDNLSAIKSRILLSLALGAGMTDLQPLFETY